jgi:predicted RNA-binding protein with PUA-like domain
MPWLVKTEPEIYSFAQLQKDKHTVWNGIKNPTALIHLRAMKAGDQVLIYHTGKEKAAVGIAKITKAPYPDPAANDPRLVVVDLAPVQPLKHPVTLATIKADPRFAGWELLRISRLSVVPVSAAQWKAILALASNT